MQIFSYHLHWFYRDESGRSGHMVDKGIDQALGLAG